MAFVDDTTGGRIVTAVGPITKLTMKAASTCNPGDPLGQNTGWVAADADGGFEAEFFAVQAAAAAGVLSAARSVVIDFGSGCTAAVGDLLYLSNTAGSFTSSAPTNAQIIGVMVSAQIGVCQIAAPAGGPISTMSAVGTTVSTTGTTSNGIAAYTTTTQADAIVANLNTIRTALMKVGILTP